MIKSNWHIVVLQQPEMQKTFSIGEAIFSKI